MSSVCKDSLMCLQNIVTNPIPYSVLQCQEGLYYHVHCTMYVQVLDFY